MLIKEIESHFRSANVSSKKKVEKQKTNKQKKEVSFFSPKENLVSSKLINYVLIGTT